MQQYFLGIDIGTQGARVALIDLKGYLIQTAEELFPLNDKSREEQSPEMWWEASLRSLKILLAKAKRNVDINQIISVAVTSTSGTIIPLDENSNPLHPALMYSDKRAAEVAKICCDAALQSSSPESAYVNFNASSGLSKMVWFVQTFPDKAARLHQFIHAADYIMGKLCGIWNTTDYTNALKSGYDFENHQWPAYLNERLPLKNEWLQKVVPSGSPVGFILPDVAKELDLPRHIHIVTGMTDGCASQVASGAISPGEWNTTIGTTLVIKGVTTRPIIDPHGCLYNHYHPDGFAMPGGASNTGADWITEGFKDDLQQLNAAAAKLFPSGKMAWPLVQKGERFPFMAPEATGFAPFDISRAELFTANMEGVAYIERYAYKMIEKLSGEMVSLIYTAGGGSNSDAWLQIRSNVLNLPIFKMKYITGSVGAAILAASKTHFHTLSEAVKAMTQIEKTVKPDKRIVEQYDDYYQQFINILINKGYVEK